MTDIRTTVKSTIPKLPFERLAETVLGHNYELSIVVCGDKLARKVNKKYRNKTYAANVLSFPLSKTEGEIFLNVRTAEREAKKYGVTLKQRLALLYVHGLFHLKGLEHGDQMEMEEQKILKNYQLD